MHLARLPVPCHHDRNNLLRAADVARLRLRDLDSLFVESRVGSLSLQMILLDVVDLP